MSDVLGGLTPFQFGIAPERSEAAARRVNQHSVKFSCQTLDANVILRLDAHRMHIRQSAARLPRLEFGEPRGGNVERVQASSRAHQRAQGQGLAPSPCTEIGHHLAALGRQQFGQ